MGCISFDSPDIALYMGCFKRSGCSCCPAAELFGRRVSNRFFGVLLFPQDIRNRRWCHFQFLRTSIPLRKENLVRYSWAFFFLDICSFMDCLQGLQRPILVSCTAGSVITCDTLCLYRQHNVPQWHKTSQRHFVLRQLSFSMFLYNAPCADKYFEWRS